MILFYSTKVSEKQLSMILTKRKINNSSNESFWAEMSEVLNAKGPSIKSASGWRNVSKYFKMF